MLHRRLATIALLFAATPALADNGYSAAAVTTAPVMPGSGAASNWPEVPENGEGWFDVGGYCKVVDVGNLDNLSTADKGVPVWDDGGSQWQNYRNNASAHFDSDVTLTTCCRPQSNVGTLCHNGTNPSSINMQYGKYGTTYTVTGTCFDQWGDTFVDNVTVLCTGTNTPNGQGNWQYETDAQVCKPNDHSTYGGCDTDCGSGNLYETDYDSCGNVTGSGYYGPGCSESYGCPPPPPPPPPPGVPSCTPVTYKCADGSVWTDCSGGAACSSAGLGACTSDCVGSTWTTSPACSSCQCGECENHTMVNSGVGCCVENANCNPGGSC